MFDPHRSIKILEPDYMPMPIDELRVASAGIATANPRHPTLDLQYQYRGMAGTMVVREKILDKPGFQRAGIYAWHQDGVSGIWSVYEAKPQARWILQENAYFGDAERSRQPRRYYAPMGGRHAMSLNDVLGFAARLLLIEDGITLEAEVGARPITDLDHVAALKIYLPGADQFTLVA